MPHRWLKVSESIQIILITDFRGQVLSYSTELVVIRSGTYINSHTKMSSAGNAYSAVLKDILSEYGARLKIDGGSKVLVSDPNIAQSLFETTEDVRTPYGPLLTIASRGEGTVEDSQVPANTDQIQADKLQMDFYTHAVFGVSSEDPKYVLEGLKHMIYAMQPKGYAVVIALRQQTGKGEDGNFVVDLVDKMKYQSKGKITQFTDVLEFAGFERGRIKSFEVKVDVGGREVVAEVALAMKWDQLTA